MTLKCDNCNRIFLLIVKAVPGIFKSYSTKVSGTQIGYRFEHFRDLFTAINIEQRVGICLDTAHAHAAGYDISTKMGLKKTLRLFDKHIGLKKLLLLHLNDSLAALGSRIDRHWHIGKGKLGKKGFKKIINHHLLRRLPAIMETPKKNDEDDILNMKMTKYLSK